MKTISLKILFYILSLFYIGTTCKAQNTKSAIPANKKTECLTNDQTISPATAGFSNKAKPQSVSDERALVPYYLPVIFHVLRDDDGNTGTPEITEDFLSSALETANDFYNLTSTTDIKFYQMAPMKFYNNTVLYEDTLKSDMDFCGSTHPVYLFRLNNHIPFVINIFCVPRTMGIDNDGDTTWYFSYSHIGNGVDAAGQMISSECNDWLIFCFGGDMSSSGRLLAHELGHYLHLSHTFAGSENITRNTTSGCYNATTAGDGLHDTGADATSYSTNTNPVDYDPSGCGYVGTLPDDGCGDSNWDMTFPSAPFYNMMSYASGCTPRIFTLDQIDRMHDWLDNDMVYNDEISSCAAFSNLTSTANIDDKKKQASDSIKVSATIHSGNYGSMTAGNYIVMKPGFAAESGSLFRAYADNCYTSSRMSAGSQTVNVEDRNVIKVSPQPFNNLLKVEINSASTKKIHYEIFNVLGENILTGNHQFTSIESRAFEINTGHIKPAIYFLLITNDDYKETIKLIKIGNE